jgi:hypothetical protein
MLARHADLVAMIDLPELAADLDTPEDYASFQRTLETEPPIPTNVSSSMNS